MAFEPKEWKDEEGPAGLVDAEALIDLEVRGADYAEELVLTVEGLKLARALNLSDLANAATARTNLGLGSAATEPKAAFQTALGFTAEDAANKDTDTALAANSDAKYPSQKAVKAYIDGLLAASDAVIYKGAIDCSTNPNYPAASAGHLYRVSVAGKIGGVSGTNVEVGDTLLCNTDGTAAGTQAEVGSKWNVIQANLDGAVIGPISATSGALATFNGATGKIVQDSGKTLSTDGTLISNTDAKVPTEKAVKTYADTKATPAEVKTEEERAKTAEAGKLGASEVAPLDTPGTGLSESDERVPASSLLKVEEVRAKAAEAAAAPVSPVGVLLPDICQIGTSGGATAAVEKELILLRATVPQSGTLHDLCIFVGTKSGKVILGVYDTGKANAGEYTRLSQGESEPATAAGWNKIYDPALTVTKGQQIMLAFVANNSTITVGKGASGAIQTGSAKLPAGFVPADGAEPKLLGVVTGSFSLPEKIAEAALVSTGAVIPKLIIGRIS